MLALTLLSMSRVRPNMTISPAKHDKPIAVCPDRPVVQMGPRELVPVTRLHSVRTVSVVNGVLTTVRVLQAA